MKRYLEKSDDLRNLQSNNHQLNMGFMKMKAMNGWKQQHFQVKFLKKVCISNETFSLLTKFCRGILKNCMKIILFPHLFFPKKNFF